MIAEQLTLDAYENSRASDPPTSHEAGEGDRSELRARCYLALRRAGARGLTDFELAEDVGSIQTSAGKRRLELVRTGRAEATGERRLSPHGRSALVWRAVVPVVETRPL